MYRFIETIKCHNGIIHSLEYHQDRINRTLKEFYPNSVIILNSLVIPNEFLFGLFKLRIIYSDIIEKIEYHNYNIRQINTIKLINFSEINYDFKFLDRSDLIKLYDMREIYDEILIIKNGLVTDTSFSNVVFSEGSKYYTPKNPLLYGTKRAKLINEKIINEINISVDDIFKFESIHLINSMLDIGDCKVDIIENLTIF